MRRMVLGLGLAAGLAACGEAAAPGAASAPVQPDDTPRGRAALRLQARLGADPVLSNLRQGTNEGKAVLCGDATAGGGAATPFVMRGGYLVLPADASPDQFATLQAMCTEAAPLP